MPYDDGGSLMAIPIPPRGHASPNDELGSELREAVEAVLYDDPPTDWAEETLESLRQRGLRTAPRQSRRFATCIALAAAASIVAAILSSRPWLADKGPEVVDKPLEHPEEAPAFVQSDAVQPTLWAYQQAVRQSPEALDALLDKHARQLLHPSSRAELGGLWQELL
jgi:hypothetical protein